MTNPRSNRHRRPRRNPVRRLTVTAAAVGAGIVFPLVGASGATATPGSVQSDSDSAWPDTVQSDTVQSDTVQPGSVHNIDHHWAHHHCHHHHCTVHQVAKAWPDETTDDVPTTETTQSTPTPTPTPQSIKTQTTQPEKTTQTTQPASDSSNSSGSGNSTSANAVQQVLDLINKARAAQGLPAYTITAGLTHSAESHNSLMAGGCGLSHQCSGEAQVGDRESAQGVQWSSSGENIGEGGPVSTSAQDIASMAVSLTQDMLNEQPPDDGHRQNILSSSFTHIGIAVQRDAQGTIWLTQDFSG
jgi:uncharacterized protein YkwD